MLRFPVLFLGVISLTTAVPLKGGGMGTKQNTGPFMGMGAGNGGNGNAGGLVDRAAFSELMEDAMEAVITAAAARATSGQSGTSAGEPVKQTTPMSGVQKIPYIPLREGGNQNIGTMGNGNTGTESTSGLTTQGASGGSLNSNTGNANMQAYMNNFLAEMENAAMNAVMNVAMVNSEVNNANNNNNNAMDNGGAMMENVSRNTASKMKRNNAGLNNAVIRGANNNANGNSNNVMTNAAAMMENANKNAPLTNVMVTTAENNAYIHNNNMNNVINNNNNAMNAVYLNAVSMNAGKMNTEPAMNAAGNNGLLTRMAFKPVFNAVANMKSALNNAEMNAAPTDNFVGFSLQATMGNAMENLVARNLANDVRSMGAIGMSTAAGNLNAMNSGNMHGLDAGGIDQAAVMNNMFANNAVLDKANTNKAAFNMPNNNNAAFNMPNNNGAGNAHNTGYGPVLMVPQMPGSISGGTSGTLAAMGNMGAGEGNGQAPGEAGMQRLQAMRLSCYVDQAGNIVHYPVL